MRGVTEMGLYDDNFQEDSYRPRQRKRQKKRGYFLAGFFGSLIGGLIILWASPYLMNLRTDSNPIVENNETVVPNNGSGTTQKVTYNVNTDITNSVEKVADTVVGITNIQGGNFWTQSQEAGTGSGVVYKIQNDSAYIVSNHHVVEGANDLEVTLSDGTKLPAELLGSDVWTDLAVLKVDHDGVRTIAEFGNSDALKLGEPVIAIGNPLGLEFAGSITQGIVSGLERTVPMDFNADGIVDWNAEVLQTDAAINPGNSGGGLFNITGQVVGINSMKIAQQEVEGIGFSIPINIAEPIIQDIERYGKVRRPYLGVALQSISDLSSFHQHETLNLPYTVKSGVLVAEVVKGSPADLAGLVQMDVIVKLDKQDITNIMDLRKYLYYQKEVDQSLTVGYYRDGQYQETQVTLTEGET